MKINRFEDLEIWQQARNFHKYIFQITERSQFKNDYRFRDQIRASSGSIMDNIAEGFERDGNKEFIQFLSVSKGSCGECRSQCYRAFDDKYISADELSELLNLSEDLSKRIYSLMVYLKKSELKGIKYQDWNKSSTT